MLIHNPTMTNISIGANQSRATVSHELFISVSIFTSS